MAQNAPFLTIRNEANFQILQAKLKKLSFFAVNPEEALKWEFGGQLFLSEQGTLVPHRLSFRD
ncbi:MAG: hypothetical protein IKW48_07980 [Akkermansia sp.]|nr:hypothetical protein [Akkermansia sp.]